MTGPPTPPPSSAIEIEDANRTSIPPEIAQAAAQAADVVPEPQTAPEPAEPVPIPAPAQPQPAAAPSSTLSPYELLFPSITSMAQNGSIRELIEVAERGDLSAGYDNHASRIYLVAPLVLAYLITDELPSARHVLTRLPDTLKSIPIIQGLLRLVASTSERSYPHVYSRSEELIGYLQDAPFPDATLSQVLAGMLTAFIDTFRRKSFTLLSKAYTSIPLPLAQSYLGLPSERVLSLAAAGNWTFDESTGILTPKQQNVQRGWSGPASTPSSLLTFNVVVDAVAALEA